MSNLKLVIKAKEEEKRKEEGNTKSDNNGSKVG